MTARHSAGFKTSRWVLVALVVATTLGASVPDAQAGSKHRRWKHRERVVRVEHCPTPRVVYRDRGDGSAIAGFLGGVVLGAVITNAAHADDRPDHYYYDPYCDLRFRSLEACRPHVARSRHPRVIRVIEYESGECTDTYRWSRDRWYDEDWREDCDD